MTTHAKIAFQNSAAESIELDVQDVLIPNTSAIDISLNLSEADVQAMVREGSDLILTLENGEIIVLKNFFNEFQDGSSNRLFLSDTDEIARVDLSHLDTTLSPIDLEFTPEIIFREAEATALFSPISIAGTLAGAAALGGALLSGGSEDIAIASAVIPDPVSVQAPTANVTVNTDGTLSVSGTAEPGSTATITFPDGSAVSAAVDANGNFGPVVSETVQNSGDVTATQQDESGNISEPVVQTYTDNTAAAAPVSDVVVNDDGTLTVSGTAEPGSTATVTFPDGTTTITPVDSEGNFGPVTSDNMQTSGDVLTTQMDAAGNVSEPAVETFMETVVAEAPDAPILSSLVSNADGTLSVSGMGTPGLTTTITFPDGSTATTTVDADGNFGPVTSTLPQTTGDVTGVQTDDSGNASEISRGETDASDLSSDPVTEPFVDTLAPEAPTTEVSENPDGTLSVSGMGEPGSEVEVTPWVQRQ